MFSLFQGLQDRELFIWLKDIDGLRLTDNLNPYLNTLIFFLLISSAFVIFELFFLRLRKKLRRKKEVNVQEKINLFFSEVFFSETQTEKYYDFKIDSFRSTIPLHTNWCKDLLIQNILDLVRNFKGGNNEKFLSVFFKLGLQEYTKNLIKSPFWFVKTKAIFFWREIGYAKGKKRILKYTEHKNPNLRSAALIAYISLQEKEPLKILESYPYNISHVEGLNILDIIQRKKIKKPEDLSSWLYFKEDTKIIFALKLVAYYNDLRSGDIVIELLNSGNTKVRNEAIKTIGELFLFSAEPDLIKAFPHENVENQIEIINVLSLIGSEESIKFLHYILRLKSPSEIQLAAMFALKKLDMKFPLNDFGNNEVLLKVKKHVETPYLID
jgi:hypothetical protein